MAKRRIRVKGQYEYFNGAQFAIAVARLYGIDPHDADEIITALWSGKFPTPDFERARDAINIPDMDILAATLIPADDYRIYQLSAMFEDMTWEPIEQDLQGYINQAGMYFDIKIDAERFAKGMTHVSDHFSAFSRELAILKSTMKQAGIAADRPPLVVFFSAESGGANEAIDAIMKSLQAFTNGVDTADNPNPAVRLPGEVELIMRRMKQGDALLMSALHRFDPQSDALNKYWQLICTEMLMRLGVRNSQVRGQTNVLKFTPQQTLIYIIDYCETYLKAYGSWTFLFNHPHALFGLGTVHRIYNRMSETTQLQLPVNTTPEHIFKIATFCLTASLNHYSDMGSRHGGIPLFADWMDDRAAAAINSIRVKWIDPNDNQAPQDNAQAGRDVQWR